MANNQGTPQDKVIRRAIGDELRRVREEHGWSRLQLVERLPSGIGDRTLLAYEHGTRNLHAVRLVEIADGLEIGAPTLLGRGLPARNALNTHPGGIMEVEPAAVRNLALFVGCDQPDLARHLSRFTPG